ncbi:response regulator [Litoribrevibacter albus]|uniref:Response regulator n=1 Tax=Litoribrevibacter albus TaxID=1473156 RepID=A0AA37S8N4_9GAMM|nr:response regulator [Litoribrevibacter albus]GLQ30533.1 response regulator [Litoribrevibacter albus]
MAKEYILCVDDDRTILMSLRAQLKRQYGERYSYEIAESAEEAWEIIEDAFADGDKVDVVISDWLMPEVKGDQFLIDLHGKYPEIIKIMLTGQADQVAIERSERDANLAACFSKPWTVADIAEAIEHAKLEKIA